MASKVLLSLVLIFSIFALIQAKATKDNLKEVTHKVYFDIEIDGKSAVLEHASVVYFSSHTRKHGVYLAEPAPN